MPIWVVYNKYLGKEFDRYKTRFEAELAARQLNSLYKIQSKSNSEPYQVVKQGKRDD